jgi:hypothetical protein
MTQHQELLDAEDAYYLTQELSLDAAPIVLPLLLDTNRWTDNKTPQKTDRNDYEVVWESYENIISNYYKELKNTINNTGIRDFNYSYYIANNYSKKYPMK